METDTCSHERVTLLYCQKNQDVTLTSFIYLFIYVLFYATVVNRNMQQ